jgi:predicted DNA-binding protein (MmcQ/YjbR family)
MDYQQARDYLLNGDVPGGEIERMIDRSYGLVVRSLKKTERDALILAYGQDAIFK